MLLPIRTNGHVSLSTPDRNYTVSSRIRGLRYWFLLLTIWTGSTAKARASLLAGDVAWAGCSIINLPAADEGGTQIRLEINRKKSTFSAPDVSSDFSGYRTTRLLSGTATATGAVSSPVAITGRKTEHVSASPVGTPIGNAPPDPILLRGPYLQNASSTAMTLRWRTDVPSQGVVRYGTSADALTGMVSELTPTIDHEVRLTGLNPQTQYFYSIGTSVQVLEGGSTNYFYTFPPEGTSKKVRIWSLGDFGIGSTRQTSVKNQMKNYLASQGDPYVDLFLWLGDNAYGEGTDGQYQTNVFNRDPVTAPWSYGYEKIMKQSPIFATPGNHDYGNGNTGLRRNLAIPYYDIVTNPTQGEAGGVPSGTESYYSFNYGQIHFVSLDSDRYEDAMSTERFVENKPQISWLKQDLAAAQANPHIKWIIAFWHHPPYTRGTHNSDTDSQLTDVRENLLPILEQYKVDLVMNGHSHVYERTRLQKGNYGASTSYNPAVHNPEAGSNANSSGRFDGSANSCYYFKSRQSSGNEGTVYVVNGHGGASGGRQAAWPLAQMASAYDETSGGSMYLEIEGGILTAKMIAGANGMVVDQFTIVKDADSFAIPASTTVSRAATCECTDKADNKTHYTDASLNKLLSIQKNGQTIGTVGDGTFELNVLGVGATRIAVNSPANYVSTPGGWVTMNRHFTLRPTTEPASPVNVSFYCQQADVEAINALLTPDLTANQLYAFHMNNVSAANVNPSSGQHNVPLAATYDADGAFIYKPGSNASVTTWKYTSLGNDNYQAETVVARLFGGGGLGGPNPIATPDLTPVLYARPTAVYGPSDISVVVDVIETNGVASSGLITLKITQDSNLLLSLPTSATSLGGRQVNNDVWQLSGPAGGYYVLSTNQSVAAGNRLSVGLLGSFRSGASTGGLSVSGTLLAGSGGEQKLNNNVDADKIDYFQQ
ncbi:purple acid phosphatase family protein [Spirosoma validum]|uniref:Metallophosphoesterase family protein n=1 Tax=Spirosoma validum TaxID=2771355 RepID=A0A927B5W2_9BACT|nr:metallophosphoesterase family protein [Spirosoma validum]MBD2755807.1 metallophosphoesterase family protein [Spirosoma validum]